MIITKRKGYKRCLPVLLTLLNLSIAYGQQNAGKGNLKYIDTRVGNVGQLLEPTRPTVQLPNQLMRMYPVRKDYIDDQISSFPLLIVSHRLGEAFSVKPSSAQQLTPADFKKRMPYDHDLEVTRPWYYSTYLVDDEIKVEYAPGKKTGFYRFTFGAQKPKHILFGNYNNGPAEWKFTGDKEITGVETYHDDIKIYTYGIFNHAGKPGVVKDGQLNAAASIAGNQSKAFISFGDAAPQTIELRYAVSFISAEQAKANFNSEFGNNRGFESFKTAGEEEWAAVINKINVNGGTDAQKRSFYSALYRCYERPVNIVEGNQYYSGYDKQVHQSNGPFYVDDWTWDTYLAHHPLRSILDTTMETDVLRSYTDMYKQSGWMPTFPVLFGDHACMNGFHSTVMFLDAWNKGIRNFDIKTAYEGMRKNATQATLLPWRNGPKGQLEDFYYSNGYYPALWPGEKETIKEVHSFEKRQAVAVTLGASYDDWALAQFAQQLNKADDNKLFAARANNYKNLWSSNDTLFMPKDDKGKWIDIDPKFDGGPGGREYYDENNGWTYQWQVQHDIPGLIDLMGGRDKFERRLDQLFRESLGRGRTELQNEFPDFTGIVGQYSMGNEPSFHIPYLYNFTGSPWKTQKRIRFLLDVWFKDNIFGIPGDEDGGGMTAFVVFSSMGFYPVTPGVPLYTIGSPLFNKVAINLPNGKQFKLIAKNASVINKYIQSAKLNGKRIDTPWFSHTDLMNGGLLEIEMGPLPNKQWGISTTGATTAQATR